MAKSVYVPSVLTAEIPIAVVLEGKTCNVAKVFVDVVPHHTVPVSYTHLTLPTNREV